MTGLPNKNSVILFILLIFIAVLVFGQTKFSFAARIDDLRQQMDETTKQKQAIEDEIKKLTDELDKTAGQSESLKKQINQLELTRKKLNSDVALTQKKIDLSNINIEQLGGQIDEKTKNMDVSRLSLAEMVRSLNETDSSTLLEIMLAQDNLSGFYNEVEMLQRLQVKVNENIGELKLMKDELEIKKGDESKANEKLKILKSGYLDQKFLVEANKTEKNQLLSETKNKESNYKKLLVEKQKLRDEFEQELSDIESQIKIEIDPTKLPQAGSGVLAWPFTAEKMLECKNYTKMLGNPYCVTQYFGVTSFAVANRNSKPHRAVDFRAPVGTQLLSSEDGVVLGQGDTDLTCRNASYGKWVVIKHNNGLSTLYAHMSLIKVVAGQTVKKGDLIGYSGNTGSSTGPHVHYSVIASQGLSIAHVPSKVCGRDYIIPVASLNSYLNPLLYL